MPSSSACPNDPAGRLSSDWRPAGLLVLAVAAVYAQTLGFGFLDWDDNFYVTENDHVRHGLTLAGLAWLPTGIVAYSWHPLTNLSLMVDATFYGAWAGGFHLTNALIHAANAVIAWRFARALTGRCGLALAAALLFAVHPLRVESVAWIAERKDVMFGFGALLAALAYCHYDEQRSALRYGYVTLAIAAAALSKPIAIVLPLLLALLDLYRHLWRAGGATTGGDRVPTPGIVRLAVEKLPWLVIAALPAAVMFLRHESSGAVLTPFSGGLTDRVVFVFLALQEYLRLSGWPSGLIFLHPMWRDYSVLAALAAVALVIGLTVWAWFARRQCPEALLGWLWFLIAILPAAGIVRVGAHSVAERYTYLPHAGLMLAVAALGALGLSRIPRGMRLAPWATGFAALALAAVSAAYTWTWRTPESVYERALAVEPTHLIARINLVNVHARGGRQEEALATLEPLRTAVASWNDGETAFNLAKSYSVLRREAWAEQWFARALELSPQLAAVWMARGMHRLERRQYAGAAEDFIASLRLRPDFRFALVGLGYAQIYNGRAEDAKAALSRAAQLDPSYAEPHFHLGVLAEAQGNPGQARTHYTGALARNPWHAAARRRLERLGYAVEPPPGAR